MVALFSQRQIQEFKEAFGIMDADKDGLLSSSDIVAAFNSVGKSVSDGEAQGMLSEAPGPVNFTQMVMLFAEKMAGGADDDDTILKAFDAFEVNGKIDADMFKHSLMTFGDKFSASEVDNAFGEFIIEEGMIDAIHFNEQRRLKNEILLKKVIEKILTIHPSIPSKKLKMSHCNIHSILLESGAPSLKNCSM